MLSPVRLSILALVSYSSAQRLTANAKCRSGYEWVGSLFGPSVHVLPLSRHTIVSRRVLATWLTNWHQSAIVGVSNSKYLSYYYSASFQNPAESNLDPLPTGYMYIGPTPAYSNRCLCSSVYYALLSACGYCQIRDYIR